MNEDLNFLLFFVTELFLVILIRTRKTVYSRHAGSRRVQKGRLPPVFFVTLDLFKKLCLLIYWTFLIKKQTTSCGFKKELQFSEPSPNTPGMKE